MKVLVESYNEICQNRFGGMRTKVDQFLLHAAGQFEAKRFDKWHDRLEDYDILHVFMANPEDCGLFRLAKARGLRTVVSAVVPHGDRFRILCSRAADRLLRLHTPRAMIREQLLLADAVIAETVIEKTDLCRDYGVPAERISVIPNGVSLDPAAHIPGYFREKTGIEGRFILQVGRFDRNKNQLSVIRAVRGTGLQLVLIGGSDKNDPDYYEACRREADDSVRFLGWVDNADPLLLAAYMECQTVVLPSYREILGNSLLEGAVCGANIVVTDVLPLDDWGIRDLCFAIRAGDVAGIREQLLRADQKPKDDALQRRARALFSWDAAIEQHRKIYESLLRP